MFGLFGNLDNTIVEDIEPVLRPLAGMAMAKKFALHDVVGDVDTWQADLEQAVLSLNDTEFRAVQIVGTYAFGDSTWVWAWGNQLSDFAENIVQDSLVLQRYGEEHGIAWLTERKFELEEDDVEAIAAVAVGITQADSYYLAFHDAGIVVFALRDERVRQALAADNPARVTSVIPAIVSAFMLYKQYEAIGAYLRQTGYHVEHTAPTGKYENTRMVAKRGSNVLNIDFNGDWLKSCSGTLAG